MLALWNDFGNRMSCTIHWRGGFLLPEVFFPVATGDVLNACLDGEPPFTIRVTELKWPACYYRMVKPAAVKEKT